MSDELDRAQMMEEKEPVHSESLFCDIDCRNDYEKEQEAKKRNGT